MLNRARKASSGKQLMICSYRSAYFMNTSAFICLRWRSELDLMVKIAMTTPISPRSEVTKEAMSMSVLIARGRALIRSQPSRQFEPAPSLLCAAGVLHLFDELTRDVFRGEFRLYERV